jgi:hypothetical protein
MPQSFHFYQTECEETAAKIVPQFEFLNGGHKFFNALIDCHCVARVTEGGINAVQLATFAQLYITQLLRGSCLTEEVARTLP